MIDIINYQIYGFPVLMYGMMAITAGGLTYATVSASGNLASTPGDSATPIPAPMTLPAAIPTPPPPPIAGGRKRKSAKSSPKRKHTGTAKKHA